MNMHIWTNLILCFSLIYGTLATVSFQELCIEIETLDCSRLTVDTDETVCDTTGKSYINFCAFDQAKCKDNSIEIDTSFSCITTKSPATTTPAGQIAGTTMQATMMPKSTLPTTTTKPTTTPIPTTTTAMPTTSTPKPTRDDMQQLFCDNKDIIKCAYDPVKVCASDGVTYPNSCEYAKVQCDNIYLQIVHNGDC